MKHIHGNL